MTRTEFVRKVRQFGFDVALHFAHERGVSKTQTELWVMTLGIGHN